MLGQTDYGPWIDLAGEVLDPDAGSFPAQRIAELLVTGLHAQAVSLNWATGGAAGVRAWPPIVAQETLDEYLLSGALWADPLVSWFERTQLLVPQMASRVPAGFGAPSHYAYWVGEMIRLGIRDRLSVPVRLGPGMHVAFVAACGDQPFTDTDLHVAQRLQPLLRGLHRQADVLDRCRGVAPAAARAGLTARELAVLRLLADGWPAAAIGRRLGISERTVHKHLEHLYRKLDARDRLSAVLTARHAGLLAEPEATGRPAAPAVRSGRPTNELPDCPRQQPGLSPAR